MEMGLLDNVEQPGIELGVLKGQRTLLREQLEARFGDLPPAAVKRLEAWPGDRLTELGRALMNATSLEEIGLGEAEVLDS